MWKRDNVYFNGQNEYVRGWRGAAARRTWKGGLLILSMVIPKSDHCPPFFFFISESVFAVSRLLQFCSCPQENAGSAELDCVGDTFNM